MRNEKITRVLRIVLELEKSRRGLAVAQLAERIGSSVRNVYRDIEAIQGAGFPLTQSGGRYAFVEGWKLGVERGFDVEGRIALAAARQVLRSLDKSPIGRALAGIVQRADSGRQVEISAREASYETDPRLTARTATAIDYGERGALIATFDRALREKLVVSCRYAALSTGQVTARQLEPGELYYDPGLETLYLIAFCRLRGAVRIFAVQRFVVAELTRERYEPRPEARSRSALRGAFRIYREGRVQRVRLRFRGAPARLVAERTLRPGQTIEKLAGGEVRVEIETDGLTEVARWVMGFGEDVVVERPGELAAAVRGAHEAAVGRYGEGEERLTRTDIGGIQATRIDNQGVEQ